MSPPTEGAESPLRRTAQLNFRCRPHERELIEAAARIRRIRPTELARDASLERAREVLVSGT